MSQVMPGFWPAIDQDGLKFAPLKRGGSWLSILKVDPDERPLSPREEEAVLRAGFQRGKNGRYILPGVPNAAMMQSIATLFGGEVKPLDPENAYYLDGAEVLEPAIPDSLRQGIAWWWGHNRQRMMLEVRQSLRQSGEEEARDILARMNPNQWRNTDHLRGWIEDAFAGDISPVTEPILGMGLAKAAHLYGDEMPAELESWRRRLADFRGDPEPAKVDVRPMLQMVADHEAEQRPRIGSRIAWSTPAGRQSGRVIKHSEENSNVLWVASDQPRFINGMPMPAREKITLEQIQATAPSVDGPSEAPQPLTVERSPVSGTAKRWTIAIEDLPSVTIQKLEDTHRLPENTREAIVAAAQSSTLAGKSPLLVTEDDEPKRFIAFWHGMREELSTDLGGESPETLEAKAIIRDAQIKAFNDLQPEVVTETTKPTLAVVPMFSASPQYRAGDVFNPEVREAIRKRVVYTVGLHPLAVADLRSEMSEWTRQVSSDPKYNAAVMDRATFELDNRLKYKALSLKGLRLSGAGSPLQADTHQWLDNALATDNPAETFLEMNQGRVSMNPEDAQGLLVAAFSDRNQLPEKLVALNKATMNSIATLAGISRHALENIQHPIFGLLDRLEARGIMKGWSRPEQLSAIGLNLQDETYIVGEIASLAGAEISLFNSEVKSEMTQDGTWEKGRRAEATSGLVKNADGIRAFSLGIVATDPDLPLMSTMHSWLEIRDTTNLAQQLKALGRLAVLGAVQPLRFVPVANDGVITQKILNELDPSWYAVPNLEMISKNNPTSVIAGSGSMIPEIPSDSNFGPRDMNEAAGASAKGLQVFTENWRNDLSKMELVTQAVQMWLDVHPHLQQMNDSGRANIAKKMIEKLVEDPAAEMIVFGSKQTSRSVNYIIGTVTSDNIRVSNYSREEAAEMRAMHISSGRKRGFKTTTFDAMSVLKPEALRYLNELKAENEKNQELASNDAGKAEPTRKRGERQNRGLVAGLSAKDLRGSVDAVISKLTSASSADQEKMARKTRLWESPDWPALRSPEDDSEIAMEPAVAAFFLTLRKELPGKSPANVQGINTLYAKAILGVRDQFEKIRTLEQLTQACSKEGELCQAFREISQEAESLSTKAEAIIGTRLGRTFEWNLENMVNFARRSTRENSEWPTELSRVRSAAAAQGEKFGAMPALKALTREGEDFRKGINTDEETLIRTFGFSGVEYGESMPQRERTEYLNHAYDGFMDLSRVLNIDPQALSLGGSLGLAFGSRGKGGRSAALAHFEPQNNVINLTRLKGAGFMAHEYGHAMANYFSRMITGEVRGGGDLAEMIGARRLIEPLTVDTLGKLRKPIYDAFGVITAAIKFVPVNTGSDDDTLELGAFKQESSYRTSLVADAQYADRKKSTRRKSTSNSKPYWSTAQELFARSFETWVDYRLNKMDGTFKNDFLVRKDKLEAWSTPTEDQEMGVGVRRPQLYPNEKQLPAIDKAFSRLVNEIKIGTKPVEHEHLGKIELPYMYSYDSPSIIRMSPEEMGAVAQSVISDVARMCGDAVEVRWENELRDDAGSLVAGRFSVIEGQKGHPNASIRGLVELAYGAPSSTAYHEAFHYAQSVLLSDTERSVLDHEFSPGQPLHDRLITTLADQDKGHLIAACNDTREAQAYAYQEWVRGNLVLRVEEQPRTFFGQIKEFCKKVLGISKESGFSQPDALFNAFYDGRLAARENLEQSIEAARQQKVVEALEAQKKAIATQARAHPPGAQTSESSSSDEPAEDAGCELNHPEYRPA